MPAHKAIKPVLSRLFLGVLFAAAAGAVRAEDGAAKTSVNVRAHPGVNQPVVGGLVPGEPVTINHCENGWCAINGLNVTGWVAEVYLQRTKFSQSWSAVSPDLPATIPNDNAQVDIGVQLNLNLGKNRRSH